jgi:flavin reductase (DIM6/NTAB) family NADH-FMN oxidoreductase RutF
MKKINNEEVKQAFQRMAKSVTLIATTDANQKLVSPATAVSNVSDNPAALLVCIEKTSSLYNALKNKNDFSVNLLSPSHKDILNQCISKKGAERFEIGQWLNTEGNLPYLSDAQACFICNTDQVIEYNTHGIFVGLIKSVSCSERCDPMVFIEGTFSVLKDR